MLTHLPLITSTKRFVSKLNCLAQETLFTSSKGILWALMGMFIFLSVTVTAQTVTTDKKDYSPGQVANASGSGWTAAATLSVKIHREPVVKDDVVKYTTTDAFGNFSNVGVYNFDETDLGCSFTLTATDGINTAVAYFTDGAADIEAWHNFKNPNPNAWSGGTTVQQANSQYSEGDVLPFQYTQPDGNPAPILLNGQTYVITLRWDFSADPETLGYFIDYLHSYDASESEVTPFDDFGAGNTGYADIPADLDATLPSYTSGQFYLYNIDPSSLIFGVAAGDVVVPGEVAEGPYVIESPSGGKITKRLRIKFTVDDGSEIANAPTSVGIAFGGHLAEENFYGIGLGAGNFPGASPQFRINFNDATSDENININPNAVVAKPRIVVIKDTEPNNEEDFTFTFQQIDLGTEAPIGDPILFNLDDDGDGVLSTTKSFLGLDPGTYTVTEGTSLGWDLSSISAIGILIQGGTYDPSTTIDGNTIRIDVELDQQVTVTFLNVPKPCDLIITADDALICYGETAALSASTTGGTSSYTYEWYEGDQTGEGIDFSSLTLLGAEPTFTTLALTADAQYTIRVIDDYILNCELTELVNVIVPSELTATTAKTDVLCFGDETGTATVIPTGGTAGYTYLWNTDPEQTTAEATGLSAGTYNVVVKDANGCTTTETVIITEPAEALASEFTQTDVLCYGDATGAINLTVSGGTAPYTYAWTGPDGFVDPGTEDLAELSPGTYQVTVTDANGCDVIGDEVIITEPAAIEPSIVAQDDPDCNGGTDGSFTVSATGGTSGYTYSYERQIRAIEHMSQKFNMLQNISL